MYDRSFYTGLRSESENEPNRTELKRFGSVRFESIRTELEPTFWKFSRTEPNPNRFFKNEVEPNRTRTIS